MKLLRSASSYGATTRALLAASVALALGCETRTTPEATASATATASARQPSHPLGERYDGLAAWRESAAASATATATAPSASAPASSAPTPAPIPSLVTGKAACDACLEAERAGRYLTPQGVGHYLVGCDDEVVLKQCAAAAKRSLPKQVQKLVAQGDCDQARAIAEFGERQSLSSPALRAALGACKAPSP